MLLLCVIVQILVVIGAESKSKKSGEHLSYPAQVSSASALRVSSNELTNAFAPPGSSTSRSVGKMTAGGAIGNKYRYRIDPSATTAAPFVPLAEVGNFCFPPSTVYMR
jgi:hypothetical protein